MSVMVIVWFQGFPSTCSGHASLRLLCTPMATLRSRRRRACGHDTYSSGFCKTPPFRPLPSPFNQFLRFYGNSRERPHIWG